jgi:hypothetical protein
MGGSLIPYLKQALIRQKVPIRLLNWTGRTSRSPGLAMRSSKPVSLRMRVKRKLGTLMANNGPGNTRGASCPDLSLIYRFISNFLLNV